MYACSIPVSYLSLPVCSVLQLVVNDRTEAASAQCTVTVLDAQAMVTDISALTFAVKDIPPGEVCTTRTLPV